ncbi:hypothetical protein [Bradyrhizobium sp. RDM4]|uniref:hypothetical protein n=1 Tax=Bradyrhizobium sp. RDM4 TaxID=3378765 RepID=UPI0038FD1E6E
MLEHDVNSLRIESSRGRVVYSGNERTSQPGMIAFERLMLYDFDTWNPQKTSQILVIVRKARKCYWLEFAGLISVKSRKQVFEIVEPPACNLRGMNVKPTRRGGRVKEIAP